MNKLINAHETVKGSLKSRGLVTAAPAMSICLVSGHLIPSVLVPGRLFRCILVPYR